MRRAVGLVVVVVLVASSASSDLYEVLGVSRRASAKAVRKAYHEKAKAVHPDKHPNDEAAIEKFRQLAAAYEVLGDPRKRRDYDDERRREPVRRHQRHPMRPRGQTVRVFQHGRVFEVPLEDFMFSSSRGPPPPAEEPSDSNERPASAAIALVVLALVIAYAYYARVVPGQDQNQNQDQDKDQDGRRPPTDVPPVTLASSVKELKLEAQRRGLSLAGCAEKDDLLRLLGLRGGPSY